jgi:serine/threonine protein kinase
VKVKNTTAGTPAYMAPELLQNATYSKSVDMYAFGVLLWEILTAEVPHKGLSLDEVREEGGREGGCEGVSE